MVLAALASNGLQVTVDAAALTPVGELQALMAGVSTYTHHLVPDDLHHRSTWSITHRPAGTRPRQTVHAIHRCGTTWPALDPPPVQVHPAPTDDLPPY